MTDAHLRQRAIALYDDFTHEHRDRRRFMADMTRLAGSLAAAELLVAGIAADPAAAAIIAEDDARVVGRMEEWEVAPGRALRGYRASPKAGRSPRPAVMVVHENRGLQPYTRDVARRLAVAGFEALAPDFLAPTGGTPVGDDDKARTMIAALDLPQTVQDGVATLIWLAKQPGVSGKVGTVGFCWGGALVDRIAVEAGKHLSAGVAFYGPAPDPSLAVKVQAPLLLHYAGLDTRVDGSAQPWIAALKAAHKDFASFVYPNVNHAFHNDTAPDRYNADAANLAWDRTIAFFRRTLG
jgi:carboxymethylenebutenolidase